MKNFEHLRFVVMYNGDFLTKDGRFIPDINSADILVGNIDDVGGKGNESIENFLKSFSIIIPNQIADSANIKLMWFNYKLMYNIAKCTKDMPEHPAKRNRALLTTSY